MLPPLLLAGRFGGGSTTFGLLSYLSLKPTIRWRIQISSARSALPLCRRSLLAPAFAVSCLSRVANHSLFHWCPSRVFSFNLRVLPVGLQVFRLMNDEKVVDTFAIFDQDGSGSIDAKELEGLVQMLVPNPAPTIVREMIAEVPPRSRKPSNAR